MSRTKPDRFDKLALLVGCRTCAAPANAWCQVVGSSRYSTQLHSDRIGPHLWAAWWQGYDEGKTFGRADAKADQ